MRQLGQLQACYQDIKAQNAEVLAVFREEKLGEEGLAKSRDKSGAEFPLLLDLDSKETSAYSGDGFHTYVIDPTGRVASVLQGSLIKRPTGELVVETLQASK